MSFRHLADRLDTASRHLGLACCVAMLMPPAALFAQGAVGSTQIRPFVTGFVPIIGRSGQVGGVSVDAHGVVERAEIGNDTELHDAWLAAAERIPSEVNRASQLRMISLPRLDAAIARHVADKTTPPDEMFFLAGLQRVEYVFVFPEQKDLVLAGPAEGWRLDQRGEMVGVSTSRPALCLDDLTEALRTAEAAAGGRGISCSIDPTEEGLARLERLLKTRGLQFDRLTVERMEQALGPQQITVTGVSPGSHFARVMVAADFMMKRLAMNFEPSPVAGMPSYMQLLQTSSGPSSRVAAPRWWLAVNYQPLLTSADGLAWRLRGQGVQAMTEDGYLTAAGRVAGSSRANRLAQQWADTMTQQYDPLSTAMPVFAKLRNCMDLAVVAALIVREDLVARAGCELPLLMDSTSIRGPAYHAPRTVASQASSIRGRQGWIVSVSGGVDIDSWSVLNRVEQSQQPASAHHKAASGRVETWWWD